MRFLRHMGPGIQCGEAWQAVICQDDVKAAGVRQSLEFRKGVNPLEVATEP